MKFLNLSSLLLFATLHAPFVTAELIERQNFCLDWNNPAVQDVATRTPDSCKTGVCGGESSCCRFHQAFMKCDTKNEHTTLACICNENTRSNNRESAGETEVVTDPAPVPQPVPAPAPAPAPTNPVPAPVMSSIAPSTSSSPSVSSAPSGSVDPDSEEGQCMNGSVWHQYLNQFKDSEGNNYQACKLSSDCGGSNKCCRREFCWCDTYANADDCVPSA